MNQLPIFSPVIQVNVIPHSNASRLLISNIRIHRLGLMDPIVPFSHKDMNEFSAVINIIPINRRFSPDNGCFCHGIAGQLLPAVFPSSRWICEVMDEFVIHLGHIRVNVISETNSLASLLSHFPEKFLFVIIFIR